MRRTAELITSDAHERDPQGPDLDARRERDQLGRVVRAELGREEQKRARLQEEGDADRADERCNARRVPERPVGEALDRDAEEPGAEHRREEHEEEDGCDGKAGEAAPPRPVSTK